MTVIKDVRFGNIYLGEGAFLARAKEFGEEKSILLTDENMFAAYGTFLKNALPAAEIFVMKAGEEYKNFTVLESVLQEMAALGLQRTSRLFAVGGGVVGDVGGLAAALYMRGITCVQVPTTLLAQVDSGVGGKTAVNFGGVKNLVGAFHQPSEVWVDPLFLGTLPQKEVLNGLGEIVKYSAIDGGVFDLLIGRVKEGKGLGEIGFLRGLIEKCVLYKLGVCKKDERDVGARRALNVGHTTGHALESALKISHGIAVALGLAIECLIAIEKGVCEQEYGKELVALIKAAILEAGVSLSGEDVSWARLVKMDKKNGAAGIISLAVPVKKGVWGSLELGFEEYRFAVERAINGVL